MLAKLAIQRFAAPSIATLVALGASSVAADEPTDTVVANPSYAAPRDEPELLDFSADADPENVPRPPTATPSTVTFDELDEHILAEDPNPVGARLEPALPEGLAQSGGMYFPEAMLDGAEMVADPGLRLFPGSNPTLGDPQDFCAFPEEVPSGIYDQDQRPGAETPRFHTVYLNYTGAVLTRGGENSAENMSNIAISNHEYPVYGGGREKAIAVAQAVQADFEDWAVRVVYLERPPKILPYTMVMIGGHYSDTTAGPSGGVAPLDCEDYGQRNVCYAFQNGAPAASQANVASQEIGHTLGLGHTQASDSVMAAGYASTQPGDLGFNDTCASTINLQGQGAACVGVNKCHCGTGEAQHDKNTLSATFAPAGPDITPPTIELLSPEDGAEFTPDDTIEIEMEPWDDVGGYGWKFLVTNVDTDEVLAEKVDYRREMLFAVAGLPEGTYEVRAVVQDHADQIGEDIAIITVTTPGSDDGADGDPDGGSDGGSGEGGADDGGDGGDDGDDGDGGDGTDGDGGGADGGDAEVADDACNCRGGNAPAAPLTLMAFVGLLALRRRN
ncbi:MAG: matrixin family metalloprotease [Myxococcota bacterium]